MAHSLIKYVNHLPGLSKDEKNHDFAKIQIDSPPRLPAGPLFFSRETDDIDLILSSGTSPETVSLHRSPIPSQVLQAPQLSALLELSQNLLALLPRRREVANHIEGTLGHVVTLAAENGLEQGDRVLEVDELAFDTSEDLGDSEGLA